MKAIVCLQWSRAIPDRWTPLGDEHSLPAHGGSPLARPAARAPQPGPATRPQGPLGLRHLGAFLALAFAITWGAAGLYFAFPQRVEAWLGPFEDVTHPLFVLAVYGPALAAFGVVAAARGLAGLRAYGRRLLHLRVHPGWYVAVLAGTTASILAARGIALALGRDLAPWPEAGALGLAGGALLLLVLDPGPVEEIGWRGFALPLLQQRMSALAASLVLGAIWGLWQLPAFLVEGSPQSDSLFWGFLYGSMALSVVMTAVYNGTGGSIPLAFLLHYANNDPLGFGKREVGGPWVLLVTAVAVLAVAGLGASRLGARKVTDPLGGR